jgi:chromosome segregation ATPase
MAAEVIAELCARLEAKEKEVELATLLLEEQATAWEARDEEVRLDCSAAGEQLAEAQQLIQRTLLGAEATAERSAALEAQLQALQQRCEASESRCEAAERSTAQKEEECAALRAAAAAERAEFDRRLAEAEARCEAAKSSAAEAGAARDRMEQLLSRLALVANNLSDRCATLAAQQQQAEQAQLARSKRRAPPVQLPALQQLLRAAEAELSILDGTSKVAGGAATEAVQQQLAAVGERVKKLAALHSSLLRGGGARKI